MIFFKVVFLFVAVYFSILNTLLAVRKIDIPAPNFILQSAGITGFITVQWLWI